MEKSDEKKVETEHVEEKHAQKKDTKKRKVKRTDKNKRATSAASTVTLAPYENKFEIEGVLKLVLSTLTQKAVGCVVGEDLTTEDPWIFVRKEKIEDNIDLHEESSEFLPIKQHILNYPEEEMLIGFDKPIEDDKQEFFVCSNVMAKNTVMGILEKQKEEMQKRLAQTICKNPRDWFSLGSEKDVDLNIIKNLRPLIEVELDSKYPLFSEKKKFKMRLVEQAIDGYVEILPGRFPITNVYKKLVDAGTQAAPPTVDNEAQTNPLYPKNVWTQYNYEYNEPKLSPASQKNLVQFMTEQADSLTDTIHVNQHINLYTNDYEQIGKVVRQSSVIVNRDIISFRDVLACKGKTVSDVALNPLVSGIIAASYTRAPFNKFYTSNYMEDEVSETVFGSHLVLIWCNSNSLEPKLYLRSYREVNKLRFCPFRPNILIGGCTNGQIVIWDLTGKLEKVETQEILAPDEQKHRLIMYSLMSWMKIIDDKNIVLPTAVSSVDHTHVDAVTGISYILPYYEVTKNGIVQRCKEGTESFQFITSGLGGMVLIWNLLKKDKGSEAPRTKKSQRLKKRPSTLAADISELREFNNFIPHYKLTVKNTSTSQMYPITCLVIRNNNFKFKALNPETGDDPFKRTFFEPDKPTTDYEFLPELKLADRLGHFLYCTFEGHEFDQGQKINHENCKYVECMLVHDGPVRNCLPNPFDEDVILTIGGRVFAIWDVQHLGQPLFWRKCKKRYVSGNWSSILPGSIVVARSDSYFETWELLNRTKTPGRLLRMSGNPVSDNFSEQGRVHVKKMTFATTDVVGAVRIYKIPRFTPYIVDPEQINKASYLRKRIFERRKQINEWLANWKMKHGFGETVVTEEISLQEPEKKEVPVEEEKVEQEEGKEEEKKEPEPREAGKESIAPRKHSIIDRITGSNKWHEKQEKLMYEILLEKKKLNLAEIEQHKIPLQKLMAEQHHKEDKIKEIIENKEEIFQGAKKQVFKESKIRKKKKFKVSFPNEIVETMKEKYIEQYQDTVEDALQYVNTNTFRYIFDWAAMIAQGLERRRAMVGYNLKYDLRKRQMSRQREKPVVSFSEDNPLAENEERRSTGIKSSLKSPSDENQVE